jgi:hypothetical protein
VAPDAAPPAGPEALAETPAGGPVAAGEGLADMILDDQGRAVYNNRSEFESGFVSGISTERRVERIDVKRLTNRMRKKGGSAFNPSIYPLPSNPPFAD